MSYTTRELIHLIRKLLGLNRKKREGGGVLLWTKGHTSTGQNSRAVFQWLVLFVMDVEKTPQKKQLTSIESHTSLSVTWHSLGRVTNIYKFNLRRRRALRGREIFFWKIGSMLGGTQGTWRFMIRNWFSFSSLTSGSIIEARVWWECNVVYLQKQSVTARAFLFSFPSGLIKL